MVDVMDTLKRIVFRLLGSNSHYVVELYYLLRHRMFYGGDRFECPCCGAHLSRFKPMIHFSGGETAGMICPRCDAHPRHRLLWTYLLKQRQDLFENNLRLLHIAPEFCFTRHFREMRNLQYISVDLASPLADTHADVCTLPFADASFDVILCNHLLEHVCNDMMAMKELYRVLKSDGWAIMQVPLDRNLAITFEDARITTPLERERHFGQHDHVRRYGVDYSDRLAKAGFDVEVIDHTGGMAAGSM